MKAKDIDTLNFIEDNEDLVVGRKYNGFSETLIVSDGEVRLFNRSGTEQTFNVPHITGIEVPVSLDLIIQCEGVSVNDTVSDAKSIFGSGYDYAISWQCNHGFARLIAFDIERYDGSVLTSLPFVNRLDCLEEAIATLHSLGMDCIWQEILHTNRKMEFYNQIVANGGEGVVVKSLRGSTKNWFKVKKVQSWDAVIMSFTDGKGKYADTIGAIVYGFYIDCVLTETGRCSGMTDDERYMFSSSPESFIGRVIELRGQEIGNKGGIVFPRFLRLRDDKIASSCILMEV